MERYSRNDVVVINYHLHIPMPDPMTNPSTIARAELREVGGTPWYAVDGAMESGGGDRSEAKPYYDKLDARIAQRLEEPAEARILISAAFEEGKVIASVTVDDIKGEFSDLRLQIALVEEELSYSGQNNVRFHPMVVRSLGGEGHRGFAVDPSGKTTINHAFDLDQIRDELKQHLVDFEAERVMTFSVKKFEMDRERLSIAAFVEDAASERVLQAAFVKI